MTRSASGGSHRLPDGNVAHARAGFRKSWRNGAGTAVVLRSLIGFW
ncbi:hypothetical protein [Mesorhizobium sp. B2-3-5]|nr:hypothetical protein [Mesorhizobium sp. B2-3-5]